MRLNAVPKDSPQYELCQDALTTINKYHKYAQFWGWIRMRIGALEGIEESKNWHQLLEASKKEMSTGLGTMVKQPKESF